MLKQSRDSINLIQLKEQLNDNKYTFTDAKDPSKLWSDTKQSTLIHSLLINIPVAPIILLSDTKYPERAEVIDGNQRLRAVYSFYTGVLRLKTIYDSKIAGRTYYDLTVKMRDRLDRRKLTFITVWVPNGYAQTVEEVKELMLKRYANT